MPKAIKDRAIDIDDLDEADFDALADETLDGIRRLRARWVGLVGLTERARKTHPGKNLVRIGDALRPLFTAMLPSPHDDAKTTANRATFFAAFHVHGADDGGKDPDAFEPGLLLRRMRRVERQQAVAEEMQAFGRLLSDDALQTSEIVLIAGQHALDTARSMGPEHPKFGAFLTTVFDVLRGMTKAALAKAAELRAQKAAAKVAAQANQAAKTP